MSQSKRLDELTKDEFLLILPPSKGSDPKGQTVILADSPHDSCCTLSFGDLDVKGNRDFAQAIKRAYDSAKLNSTIVPGSGFAPRASVMTQPEPPPLLTMMPKTDTTSATVVHLPILVYQSPRRPGINADGSKAADMVSGDMTAEEIRQIPTAMGTRQFDLRDPKQSEAKYHFMNFRNMATGLFSYGEMQMVILAMIAKFERNEGGEFRHPLLTQHAKAEHSTQLFVKAVMDGVNTHIKATSGNINQEPLAAWMGQYPTLRPPVLGAGNFLRGLAMAVHDTWGARAELVQFAQHGKHYKGRVKFTLYDHFGLDMPDVGPDAHTGHIKPYSLLSGFRSWFILQHYERFAYKPFISMMEFHYQIEGDIE